MPHLWLCGRSGAAKMWKRKLRIHLWHGENGCSHQLLLPLPRGDTAQGKRKGGALGAPATKQLICQTTRQQEIVFACRRHPRRVLEGENAPKPQRVRETDKLSQPLQTAAANSHPFIDRLFVQLSSAQIIQLHALIALSHVQQLTIAKKYASL